MNISNELQQLLRIIDQAYDHRSWHGTTLRGSVRGVPAEQAMWRPGLKRHNIWEIVVHAAYWKYTVWRRLTGTSRGSFPQKGSDWFPRPDKTQNLNECEGLWREDIALLDRMHRMLRDAAEQLPISDLYKKSKGSKQTNFFVLSGIAAHDIYHAGQIQFLKKLWKGR